MSDEQRHLTSDAVLDQGAAMNATACVSCHRDGSFTYHDGIRWIQRAPSVPASALARLPADERARVERVAWRRMGEARHA